MAPVKTNDHQFTFNELVAGTGADDAWLRTVLQRDKAGVLGSKHRLGRLLFSIEDAITVTVLWGLNHNLRVAPAAAWEVVRAVPHIIVDAIKKGPGDRSDLLNLNVRIAFDEHGDPLIWTRQDDGLVLTWNENANKNQMAAFQANKGPHIVFPLQVVFDVVGHLLTIVVDEETKE